MNPVLVKEERNGWPSQPLPKPRAKLPDPWSVELLLGVQQVRHHALSPDGSRLAFIWDREGNSDLWVMPARAGAWPERLTFDRPAIASWIDIAPRWSPDGKYLTYVCRDEIWTVPAEGGRARRLTDHGHESTEPIFSPDSRRVYYVSKRGTYGNLAATTPEGDWPVALTRFEGDVSDPRPSPDGRRVAFVYHPPSDLNRSEICLMPAAGGEVRHLTGQPGAWDVRPRWAPDGSRLAFISNRSGYRELYLLDPESGESLQLTAGMADVQAHDWSPDGTQLAHVADHNGAGDLHLVTVATREDRRLRGDSGWHSLPQWSPDGKAIFVGFESSLDAPDLWKVHPEGGEAERLTQSMPPALRKASLRAPQFVRYPSTRGATIPAFLYRPSAASAERPCPAIVYPHGGPTSEYVLDWDLMAQWLVAKGYAVLAPNYRGSTGYGLDHQHALHDEWGIVDTEDMLAAADYLRGLDWVDGDRLGILGFSYGSYLALLALARDPDPKARFKCGVCIFGDCDILTSWAQGDRVGREDLERQMADPSQNRSGYLAGSPVYDVEKIRYPLLIFHGEEDKRVHPLQSEQLTEALKRHGKTYEYFVYGGEGHGFLQDSSQLHFHATVQRFLDWYLM